ncbi:MAG: hypothetical protein AAF907_16845 [Planctomycetota bacterium]
MTDSNTSRPDTVRPRAIRAAKVRRLKLVAALAVLVGGAAIQTGCVVPIYATEREERARQLLYVSENLRHITRIWERIWFLDLPDTATPYRTHGGII